MIEKVLNYLSSIFTFFCRFLTSIWQNVPFLGRVLITPLVVKKALTEWAISVGFALLFVLIPFVCELIQRTEGVTWDGVRSKVLGGGQLYIVCCSLVAPIFYTVLLKSEKPREAGYVTEFPDGVILSIFSGVILLLSVIVSTIGSLSVSPTFVISRIALNASYWFLTITGVVLALMLLNKHAIESASLDPSRDAEKKFGEDWKNRSSQ